MKLITTQDYLVLIDEEDEIKDGDYILSLINNTTLIDIVTESDEGAINGGLIKWTNRKHCSKIIAYYPLIKEAKELALPLLPNPFEEVEELAIKHLRVVFTDNSITISNIFDVLQDNNKRNVYKSFISGYLAQSKQRFSLEDMCSFAEYTGNYYSDIHKPVKPAKELLEEYIQSLSTQQTYPKEFIPEYEDRIALDGHTIVGKELKTITNSEGKETLVGTYKY